MVECKSCGVLIVPICKTCLSEQGLPSAEMPYLKSEITKQDSEIASLKAEVERLKADRRATLANHKKDIIALEQRVKELEKALEKARDAIAQAPEDAFGDIPDTPDRQGWWIRDELVDSFNKALSDTERRSK